MLSIPAGMCALLLTPLTPFQAPVRDTKPEAAVDKTSVAELMKLIEEQNRKYESRIQTLESQLDSLRQTEQSRRDEDELDELLRLAEASGPAPVARSSATPSFLNPQISVIPDFVVRWHDIKIDGDEEAIETAFPELFEETDPFNMRETEIEFRAAVSPEADAVAILAVGDEEVAFEEVYITFHSLPFGVVAKVGKFLLDFGRANRVHQHDLPQIDRPLVHSLLFGPEGTASPGISLSKMLFTNEPGGFLPTWSEFILEGINSMNEEAPLFGEGAENEPAVNMRWKNFWQISAAADLEGGASLLLSPSNKNGLHQQTTALGADVTWRWADPEPGSYDNWLVQGEVIGSSVDGSEDGTVSALGGYLTVQKQIDPQWYAGIRADTAQSPYVADASAWGLAPYVTHYLNEFIRLRLQYNYLKGEVDGDTAVNQGLSAQIIWVFGAHPPEPYWVNR